MTVIEKASATALYGGASTAFVFGLTPNQWQVIGVVSGVVIGVLGLVINTVIQWKRLEMDRERR